MRHKGDSVLACTRRGPHPPGMLWILLGLCCLLLVLVPFAIAQTGDGYDLSRWTVDAGGTTFSLGGGYSLGGTAGQPDAGVSTGGGYFLAGGFWPGVQVPEAQYRVYLPLVMRSP